MKVLDLFKKNKDVIILISILLVLILIRSTGMDHFRSDAKKWAEPSVNQSNLITADRLKNLSAPMIISLDKSLSSVDLAGENFNMPADSVLSDDNIRKILKYEGPVVIRSLDPGLSARIWMLLSQMGRDELYILTENAENEVLKFEFQTDTSKIN